MSEVRFLREVAEVVVPAFGILELNEYEDGSAVITVKRVIEEKRRDFINIDNYEFDDLLPTELHSKHDNVLTGKKAFAELFMSVAN